MQTTVKMIIHNGEVHITQEAGLTTIRFVTSKGDIATLTFDPDDTKRFADLATWAAIAARS